MSNMELLDFVISQFQLSGKLIEIAELKKGHINDTYVSTWSSETGVIHKYVHQRLNSNVFPNIDGLMSNIIKIIDFLKDYSGPLNQINDQRKLELISTKSGAAYVTTENGDIWRTYNFVPDTETYLLCESESMAFEAARTCGYFQLAISELDHSEFVEVIPGYHNLPSRYAKLKQAVAKDVCDRVRFVTSELKFIEERSQHFGIVTEALGKKIIPTRLTHCDLKYNNVLFDCQSKRAVCVVDLDTCMPSSPLYDFGDLVRSAASTAEEDQADLDKVGFCIERFRGLANGYLGVLKEVLTPEEQTLVPIMPEIYTMTLAIRFLTDYLMGDVYFKTHYPDHNYVRAVNQLKVVASIEEQKDHIKAILDDIFLSNNTAVNLSPNAE